MEKTILNYAQTQNLKEHLFTTMSMSATYRSWDAEFARQQVTRFIDKQAKEVRIDPTQFLIGELLNLGFRWWDDKRNLLLIPLWMHPFLEEGITLRSIANRDVIVELDEDFRPSNVDDDSRGGVLAFGVVVTPPDTKEEA
jgi:hypothetical protein